eukprot:TRINITY_DN2632_c0_g1_i1.p1 TRINITY_DN2632_c0_g1~~TRINITY_DN2632_c0_g1_i1.p1  ORF type:complete len:429 (-),score=81.38 TRINITY_DN2632_c0_g1_i1:383-1669(-)
MASPSSAQGVMVTVEPRTDPSQKMLATEWRGKKTMKVEVRARPLITNSKDVILRVTSTAICGSDLHIYNDTIPGVHKGYILGHEFMGLVEEIGPDVEHVFRKGDRVVASCWISCGECSFCKDGNASLCDNTNPLTKDSQQQEHLYGDRTGSCFGYGHLVGGYWGGQAELVRVPLADLNLLKVPAGVPDEKVMFLSDLLPTAWYGTDLAEVSAGDTVAIWGSGPVGMLAAHCALYRKASHVILIDEHDYRLEFAEKAMTKSWKAEGARVSTINFSKKKVKEALSELVGLNGVDCTIDCVGVHYVHTATHKAEMAVKAETDSPEVINEMITCVRKGGRIGVIGVYVGLTNHFNIGGFMEKGLSMRGGQVPVHRYWKMLLDKVVAGELNPAFVVTHELPLTKAEEGYRLFDKKEDGCIKVVLKPNLVSKAA